MRENEPELYANFEIVDDPKKISVIRGAKLSIEVWRRLRNLLASDGINDGYEDKDQQFYSSIHDFLSKQGRLRLLLNSYKTQVELVFSDEIKTLLVKIKKSSDEVNRLISESPKSQNLFYSGDTFGRIRSMTDEGKKIEPKEFQKRDLNKVLSLSNAANFSVPGAGKTLVTLLAYEMERVQGRVDQLMVIAPLSAFEAWEKEFRYLSAGSGVARIADRLLAQELLPEPCLALACFDRNHTGCHRSILVLDSEE